MKSSGPRPLHIPWPADAETRSRLEQLMNTVDYKIHEGYRNEAIKPEIRLVGLLFLAQFPDLDHNKFLNMWTQDHKARWKFSQSNNHIQDYIIWAHP